MSNFLGNNSLLVLIIILILLSDGNYGCDGNCKNRVNDCGCGCC